MSTLYAVYQDGNRACGVSVLGPCRQVVYTVDGRVAQTKTIALEALGTVIGDLLRQGFKQTHQVAFLSEKNGFQTRHPDFDACDGKYLIYCYTSDIAQAVKDIEALALAGAIQPKQRHALMEWLRSQDLNDEMVVAPKANPEFAIVLAEVAHRNGWVIHSASDGIPASAPSANISMWCGWLSIGQESSTQLKSAFAAVGGAGVSRVPSGQVSDDSDPAYLLF